MPPPGAFVSTARLPVCSKGFTLTRIHELHAVGETPLSPVVVIDAFDASAGIAVVVEQIVAS